MFPHRRPYGGVCCLITATIILPVNKTFHNTAVFSLLVTNTEVLLTTEFPCRHDSLFFTPSFPFYQVGFFFCAPISETNRKQIVMETQLSSPLFISLFPDPLSHGKCDCQCALRLQSCGKFGLGCG